MSNTAWYYTGGIETNQDINLLKFPLNPSLPSNFFGSRVDLSNLYNLKQQDNKYNDKHNDTFIYLGGVIGKIQSSYCPLISIDNNDIKITCSSEPRLLNDNITDMDDFDLNIRQYFLDILNITNNRNESYFSYQVINETRYDLSAVMDYSDSMNHISSSDISSSTTQISSDKPLYTLYNTPISGLQPVQIEVGLYDRNIRKFLSKEYRDMKMGELASMKVNIKSWNTCTEHSLTVHVDLRGLIGVMSYLRNNIDCSNFINYYTTNNTTINNTTDIIMNNNTDITSNIEVSVNGDIIMKKIENNDNAINNDDIIDNNELNQDDKSHNITNLRIMTYNIWHNNPPSWLYRDYRSRWARYESRLQHLARIIIDEDPDIVMLQEVRLDSSFRREFRDENIVNSNFNSQYHHDSGNQGDHLLEFINLASKKKHESSLNSNEINNKNKYQIVFQPVMNLLKRGKPSFTVEEEGLAILIKADLTVIDVNFVLLPRDFNDKVDDHNRGLLSVLVLVQGSNGKPYYIECFTSHLSLSIPARELSAFVIRDFSNSRIKEINNKNLNYFQFFTGDLNAEPLEETISLIKNGNNNSYTSKYVQNNEELNSNINNFKFVDIWEYIKLNNNNNNNKEEEKEEDAVGYTYPICNPIKRIDFIFIRNDTYNEMNDNNNIYIPSFDPNDKTIDHSTLCINKKACLIINDIYITGKLPTKETSHLVGSRDGIGMLDEDSPVWPSDHFALVTDIELL